MNKGLICIGTKSYGKCVIYLLKFSCIRLLILSVSGSLLFFFKKNKKSSWPLWLSGWWKWNNVLYITISDHRRLVTFIITDASFLLQLYIFSVSLIENMNDCKWNKWNSFSQNFCFISIIVATIYCYSFNKKRILHLNMLVWQYNSVVNSIDRCLMVNNITKIRWMLGLM